MKNMNRILPVLHKPLLALLLLSTSFAAAKSVYAQNETVLSLNQTEGIKNTFDPSPTHSLKVIPVDNGSALDLQGTTLQGEGTHYFGIMVPLGRTWDLTAARLALDARTTQPGNTAAFYVRAYNQGEKLPCLSFSSFWRWMRSRSSRSSLSCSALASAIFLFSI